MNKECSPICQTVDPEKKSLMSAIIALFELFIGHNVGQKSRDS